MEGKDKITSFLRGTPGLKARASEISKGTGLKLNTVYSLLSKLRGESRVIKSGDAWILLDSSSRYVDWNQNLIKLT